MPLEYRSCIIYKKYRFFHLIKNRNHFLCTYRVLRTRVGVRKNEKNYFLTNGPSNIKGLEIQKPLNTYNTDSFFNLFSSPAGRFERKDCIICLRQKERMLCFNHKYSSKLNRRKQIPPKLFHLQYNIIARQAEAAAWPSG